MIGLAVITYKRYNYLLQCIKSLAQNNFGGADYVVIVEDDMGYTTEERDSITKLLPVGSCFISQKNRGVASAKNTALKELGKCDHIFLMEDDILMLSPNTCQEYIEYAKTNNVEHMNFAHHGTMNDGRRFYYKGMTVYPECIGAFSYYTKNCLEQVGLIDENFVNAWEHVEHTWRISEAGLTTPFWKFVDHPMSHLLLQEIPGSITNSSIRPRKDWKDNIKRGVDYWKKKHGSFILP